MNKLFIEKFYGIKRINVLESFSFIYHPFKEDLKKHLFKRDQKFREMRDFHHVYY
jgi:hypothetical protein